MKKLLSIVLLAVLTLSFIACEQTQKADKYCVKCGTGLVKNAMYCSNCGNPVNNNVSNLPDETQNTTVKLTPRPRPQQFFCEITKDQKNNYYVSYSVTENAFDGTKTTEKFVEVGYNGIILISNDGGKTFRVKANKKDCFSISNADENESFFSAHLRYYNEEFEEQGTKTIAGIVCSYYLLKKGKVNYHFFVDENFNSTGITLKFVTAMTDNTGKTHTKTMVVDKLLFGAIDNKSGYNFVDFNLVK